ncbi:CpaF family protein [Vibrio mediterranei]|uniref:CpaF family protein n=1 Tax=Vibrio mediterranei TaxID=689 RepID=UPI00148B9DF1|nr:CpaF family protein [Vibrio mediterranei]NOI26314.1 CpaF family protein [Vibrio mediterranei]
MQIDSELYLSVRERIFDAISIDMIHELSKKELYSQIKSAVNLMSEQAKYPIASNLRDELSSLLTDEFSGLGPIQPLLDDPEVSEVMVNSPKHIFVEKRGKIGQAQASFVNEDQVVQIAKRIANTVGRRVDETSPMVDARLSDGSRVNIVLSPITLDGTTITIRKFPKFSLDLEAMVELGTMSSEMANLLMIVARCKLNIIISGGTGSGKTTLLNALSNYIDWSERIVTIEDAAELRLQQEHVVRMETRAAGIENNGAIGQRELVINALRMRPDRIVLGECRGGEAFEMLQAMNTGHDGSMSTLHANTPRDAIHRLESMVMMANLNQPLNAIRRAIVSAVNVVIQISRLRDGSRKVVSIAEVVGLEGDSVVMDELYRYDQDETKNDLNNSEAKPQLGRFVTNGISQSSEIYQRASYYGLSEALLETFERARDRV